ncbi:hypothetical protein BN1708_017426 [Verticillium longisporum]|uniref:Uncharacterized protein n=1 Tax=Verticillium longisporum TaxID=100787 RepID=A0A0G4L1G7_VERLO|nr:hypothetical protein BN1708_017426 [Verticillium longisporum]
MSDVFRALSTVAMIQPVWPSMATRRMRSSPTRRLARSPSSSSSLRSPSPT